MNRKIRRTYEDFLNPELLRGRMIIASIYIAAFELLRQSIIGRIESLFTRFTPEAPVIAPEYESDVRSRNQSSLYASLAWLQEMKAIGDTDLAAFKRIKACRNELAHSTNTFLGGEGTPSELEACFREMVTLMRKIEVWWIKNVELPTNPDFDHTEVDEDDILPGPVIAVQLMFDIALGSEDRSRYYYDKFREMANREGV